jgi:hydrogenase maturation protease
MKNLKTDRANILLIAIGNSGRNDDGLGWKFAEKVQHSIHHMIDVEYRYQLQVEDAALVYKYNQVFFADASHAVLENGFEIKACTPANHYFFSSHVQAPETILYLDKELYDKTPEAFTIAITGDNWGLGTTLSAMAEKNLQSAFNYFIYEFLPAIQKTTKSLH